MSAAVTKRKNRRRRSVFSFGDDESSVASSNAAGTAVTSPVVGRVSWFKKGGNNVIASSPLNVTASTASMSDTSFGTPASSILKNSLNTPGGTMTPSPTAGGNASSSSNRRVRFDCDDRAMKEKAFDDSQEDYGSAQVVSPFSADKSWTEGFNPFEDGNPFDCDHGGDDEFNFIPPSPATPATNPFDDGKFDTPGFSPTGVYETDLFASKQLHDAKETAQSPSSPTVIINTTAVDDDVASPAGHQLSREEPSLHSSVNDDVIRSLQDENERLKTEVQSVSEGGGGALDEVEVGRLEISALTDADTFDGTYDTYDEATHGESTYGDGTASFYSECESDYSFDDDDVSLESVTFGGGNDFKVKEAGPSSGPLRLALRNQNNSGIACMCPAVLEEVWYTYEDANKTMNQLVNAFLISLDDIDNMSDVIRGSTTELGQIYMAPDSKQAITKATKQRAKAAKSQQAKPTATSTKKKKKNKKSKKAKQAAVDTSIHRLIADM